LLFFNTYPPQSQKQKKLWSESVGTEKKKTYLKFHNLQLILVMKIAGMKNTMQHM